ncbi:MAG: CU044_5270 family protein [Aeromicrobium sp.]
MNHDDRSPESSESELLRRAAKAAGLRQTISPELLGIELESADEFLTRMRDNDRAEQEESKSKAIRRRVLMATGVAAAGSVLILSVIQPWNTSTAIADTPPILNYQFASPSKIAFAPGEDPVKDLLALSKVAKSSSGTETSGDVQHVLTNALFANIGDEGTSKSHTVQIPQIEETWLRPDGSLRTVERSGKPLSPDGRGLSVGASPQQPDSADETEPKGSLDANFVKSLPASADGVRAALLKRAGCTARDPGTLRSLCLYNQIADLYSKYVIPPQVASTFWKVLAKERGFRLLGKVEDRANRPGIGISLIPTNRNQYRLVLIISPLTGQLLGTEAILIKQQKSLDVQTPAVMSFTATISATYTK